MVILEDEVLKASMFIQGADSDCPWSDEGLPTFLCVPTPLQHHYKYIPMLPCLYFSAPESSSRKPKITTQKPEHDHVRVSLEYFAEGAANIVYRMQVQSDVEDSQFSSPKRRKPNGDREVHPSGTLDESKSSAYLQDKLLRLRKLTDPSKNMYEKSYEYFNETIKKLFDEENLVGQELIEVPTDLLDVLNNHLVHKETIGSRPHTRHKTYLDKSEELGLLIDDMTPRPGKNFMVEFKPKWLVQSPNAPLRSLRCRTCAKRALMHQTRESRPGLSKETAWCPLSLTQDAESDIKRTVDIILSKQPFFASLDGQTKQRVTDILHKYFIKDGRQLLQKLAQRQQKLDPRGVLCEVAKDSVNTDLLTAMSLRDCTLYLRFSWDDPNHVEAKFGDLDAKHPALKKFGKWREMERSLVNSGYYIGEEKNQVPEKACLLTLRFPDFPYFM